MCWEWRWDGGVFSWREQAERSPSWGAGSKGMVLEENEQDSEVGELMDRDSEDLGITQCNKSSEERRDVIRHVYL